MADPKVSSSFGWTHFVTKAPLTGFQVFKDASGNVVSATVPAGTTLRVYEGKVEYPRGDGATLVLTTPDKDGNYFVETVPDSTSVGWTTYPNDPRYTALMTSPYYTAPSAVKARPSHMLWVPLKMAGEYKPDLLDAAKEAELNDTFLAPLPEGFKKSDTTSTPTVGGGITDWQTIAIAAAAGIALALILSNLGKSGKSR
jgi:hypothetical protein